MKIGNYNPDIQENGSCELRDVNLNDLRARGVPESSITRLKDMYHFDKIIEFLSEVRRIESHDINNISLSSNTLPLQTRYFLVCNKPIGAGGMGKVYLFYDRNKNQYVVFKLVPVKYIRKAARLQREEAILKALNKLNSSHLVKVLGLGIADFSFLYTTPSNTAINQDLSNTNAEHGNKKQATADNKDKKTSTDELLCYEQELLTTNPQNVHIFLVMSYIQGQTLESYCLTHGPKYEHYSSGNNLFELLRIIIEAIAKIAEILNKIHGLGLVHRDIKPNNIIMQSEDMPVLIDFGIAQRQDIEGDHQSHCSITHGLGNPGYRDPCTSQYETNMKLLQEKIDIIIKDTATAEHWKSLLKELKETCAAYPLQTQRLSKQIRQYQRELFSRRWFHPKQWLKKQSISAEQWMELKILVEELQRCSHPYEDVFSLGATLYWCLTGTPFLNSQSLYRYLGTPVKVEISFTPSLFGVDNPGNTPQKNDELKKVLNKVEIAISNLLTKMLQHPLEQRCTLKEVQQEIQVILKMLPTS